MAPTMVTRRSLLTVACAWAFTLLGCSDKGSGSAAGAGKELVLFGWSEYLPSSVIDGFSKETGITVHYETFSSNEEMLSKLLAGGTAYDLVQPSNYAVEALVKQGKLAPLDPANVPNLKNIADDMRGLPHDPDFKHCAPYMASTTGIVVNTDRIKDPIRGFKDVFQEKHKGRIVVVNDAREMVSWAFATLGIGANDVTQETLAKARPVLAEWVKLVKVFDSDSPKTAMLSGDVDIGVVWSGEAAILYEQDRKYTFVMPEEGAHLAMDYLCVPKTAKNKAGAEKFIDYVLRPEVSKLISDKFPYTNPNAPARKLLTDAQRANPASYPTLWFGSAEQVVTGMPDRSKRGDGFRDIGKISTEVDRLVTDLKSTN